MHDGGQTLDAVQATNCNCAAPGGMVQSYAPNQILTQVPGSKDGENMVPDLEKENISSNDLNSESLTGLV